MQVLMDVKFAKPCLQAVWRQKINSVKALSDFVILNVLTFKLDSQVAKAFRYGRSFFSHLSHNLLPTSGAPYL